MSQAYLLAGGFLAQKGGFSGLLGSGRYELRGCCMRIVFY